MESVQNIKKALREIWRGSGNVTILLIAILTLLIYVAFLYIINSDVLLLLTKIKDKSDFSHQANYLLSLETLQINNTSIIVTIIFCIAMLLFKPIQAACKNQLIFSLPISPRNRIVAFIISIAAITLISFAIISVLNWSIVTAIKQMYLDEVIQLRQNIGNDIHVISSDSYILNHNYQHDYFSLQIIFNTLGFGLILIGIRAIINLFDIRYIFVRLSMIITFTIILVYISFSFYYAESIISAIGISKQYYYNISLALPVISIYISWYYLLKNKQLD